ncbi:hypothetical protein [Bradyrhizobium sp. 150]|uniref:hypothetical protein n=1 Tax=Bradyrhizobium sp. 150 TaxID=2782625 RepID=UPI001FFA0E60|nr:hypothetical protein [Bradyrhizobium sp. 150]MCK1677817.1 hypothetical protein [Bradyrhizobium sp. 150]
MDQETSSKWLLQPVEEWSGNKQPVTSVLLGILVCSGAIMILLHGIGLGSWSSAAVLICPLVGLVAVGHFRNTIWDSVFLLFVLWLGISTVVNGPGPLKEEILFILTLAAYPAARLSGTTGRPFFAVLGLVGFLGLVCIVVALRDQWSDLHGKPLVFGTFDAAPAQISVCFALLLAGLVASHLNRLWLVIGYICAGVVFAILAASLLRFSFVAGEVSPQAEVVPQAEAGPAPCGDLKQYNSVLTRKKLISDVASAIPRAGIFGHGLSSFTQMTCLGMETHLSLAQVVIEFGWVAGVLLGFIALGALAMTARLERAEARFAFMGFLFVAMLSFAHGDLARDGLLFLFLGYLVRISEPQP